MRSTLQLTFKQHRFGIVGFGVILIGLAVAAWVLAAFVASFDIGGCAASATPECDAIAQEIGEVGGLVLLLRSASMPVAILAGIFLGVPIVASEIERGTAVLPWTFSHSRLSWFLPRVLFLGGIVTILTAGLGLSLDALHHALNPLVPITADLDWYWARGWLVPARALVGFTVGVLTGAVLGRSLPSLLTATVVTGVLIGSLVATGVFVNQLDAVDVSEDPGALRIGGVVLHDQVTGGYVGYEEAEGLLWPGDPAFGERFHEVRLGVPGSSSSMVVTREVALHVLVVLATLAASAVVVDRRRPY